MRIRIHLAVGSTAMTKKFDLDGVAFRAFVQRVERARRDDTIIHFSGAWNESFSVAARSIVLVEKVAE